MFLIAMADPWRASLTRLLRVPIVSRCARIDPRATSITETDATFECINAVIEEPASVKQWAKKGMADPSSQPMTKAAGQGCNASRKLMRDYTCAQSYEGRTTKKGSQAYYSDGYRKGP